MPSGSNSRSARNSGNGRPETRAISTPRMSEQVCGAPIPPWRRDFIELGGRWLDETCWDCDHIWRQVTRTGASVAEKARLPSDCGGLDSADLDPLPGQHRRSGELVDELLVGDVVDARARVLAGHAEPDTTPAVTPAVREAYHPGHHLVGHLDRDLDLARGRREHRGLVADQAAVLRVDRVDQQRAAGLALD